MSKRIDTGGGESLGSNPFGGLSSAGLPEGQATSAVPAVFRKTKPKASKGRVEIRRDQNGRGGKTVTTLTAFANHLPLGDLDRLAFDLKKACASGGTRKGRSIELQGDVRDRAFSELEKRGFQPVLAGG